MAKPPRVFETAYETYTTSGIIGEGGSGMVYAVTDTQNRPFALKVLAAHLATATKRKRFKNEIEFCRKNRHANILSIVDVGLDASTTPHSPFYVMQRYPQTLRDVMKQARPSEQSLRLFSQMIDGVEAAHLAGVTHRDVKPENILVDLSSSSLVVADFGIAHFEEEALFTAVETKPADRLANFLYAAPEQRIRGAAVDLRADIFALGLILNEMFTGMVPHGAGYRRIADVNADYIWLDELVDSMLHQDPLKRPASIDAIKQQLIGRRQNFVTQQQLDAKKQEVVPTYAAGEVKPVALIGIDWDKDNLILKLSRSPEAGFVSRFSQPRSSYTTMGRFYPGSFHFHKDTAVVNGVQQTSVQGVVDLFKARLGPTHAEYQEDLRISAARQEEEAKRLRQAEVARLEQRASVLRNVKF